MADITNAAAVAFSNGRIRPLAQKLAELYDTSKRLVEEWNARSMSSLIPNTADPVIDGQTFGITGAQATAIVTRAMEFCADYEAFSNAKLNTVTQVALNP